MRLAVIYFMFASICSCLHARLEFAIDEINDSIEDIVPFYNFTYKFSNIGSTPIKILDIKTSCICTIPSTKKNIFMPNESGEITGYINISDKAGLQETIITVYTDSISQPQKKLFLKINIINPIEIKPHVLFWPKCDNNNIEKTIHISNNNNWKLHNTIYNRELFAIKIKKKSNGSEIKVIPVSVMQSLSDTIKIDFINEKSNTRRYIVHLVIR